jgi:hypothetical protein
MRAGTQRAGIVAVVAAALTMGLTFAHTLELPQKLGYDAATWTGVQQSLYRYFGLVGGPVEVAAVIAAVVFALRTRGRPGGRLAAVGAACFVIALAFWFAVINTANAEIGSWAVDAAPPDWERWRAQWEFGHAVHFALALAGFLALLLATVRAGAAGGGAPGDTATRRAPEPALPGERHGAGR